MSTTIDERVVEMRFDNKHFESNVQDTMNSLDKLKQKLNLTGAAKGLDDVNAAAKKVDMTGLGAAVDTVQAKFSALQVMGVTALMNITNSAVNAGKRIISALTIDPVKTGFSEYETKIGAIQTIMSNTASKGTTMEDVTRVISELNTYADKTIYNFAEMTRNIGTFTAAGVGLEESASAIQGIANLAAASGSTSQQASTAMYQLSQALSSGTVKLMDWNSVVNAGMGGEKFQEALKATAREHGVAVDNLIKKNGSFRESLSEGWITADILNETLRKFTVEGAKEYANSMIESGKWTKEQADALIKEAQAMEDAATKVKTFTQLWDTLKESAQSGWAQTWEIIVGDFEEAKETLTKFSEVIGDMINSAAEARNELLQGWKDAGGRADLIESIYNVFEGVVSVIKPIKEAFREIFPATTVKQLVGITSGIKEFTEKLKLSEATSDKLKRTFKGLFAVLDIVRQIFFAVFKAVGSLFGVVGDLSGGILSITAKFGDWLVKLNEFITRSQIFSKGFQGIAIVIKTVYAAIKRLISALAETFISPALEALHVFLGKIYEKLSGVGDGASAMKDEVVSSFDAIGSAIENSSLYKMLQTIWKLIKAVFVGVGKVLGGVANGIVDALSGANLTNILELINGLISGGIGIALIQLILSIKNSFRGVSEIIENLGDSFYALQDILRAYSANIKANALLKIAAAIAILAVAVLLITSIDSDKLYDSIIALTALFAGLMGTLAVISKKAGVFKGVMKISTLMISLSISVLILASALKKVASLNFDEMMTGLLGVAGLMGIVIGTIKLLNNSEKTIMKGATQMLILAGAIKILASACIDLSLLSLEELAKGLLGVGILIAEVSLFMSNTTSSGKAVSTGIGIVLLASAIKILASACRDFSRMDLGEIARSLIAVGAILAGFVAFNKLIGDTKGIVKTGIAMIAIAASMKIFASAAQDMASMSWPELARGLVGMAVALLAVTAAVVNMPKNMIGKGIALIAIATALLIMANAIGKIGSMSCEAVAKGLRTLAVALTILTVALHAMNGTAKGVASLLLATAALALLTPVLAILGAMSWESIFKGLITLAAAFTIIGVAGYALSPIISVILKFSAAILLIGAGVAILGVGLLAVGAGLSAIAIGITALVAALLASAAGIVNVVIDIVVGIITGLGQAIVLLCKVIAAAAPAIGEAIKALIIALCDVLVECIPTIVDTVLEILVRLLDSLVRQVPVIVDALFNLIIGILDSLARNIPTFIKKIFEMIGSIFTGVVEALKEIDPDTLIKGLLSVGLMAALMYAFAGLAALAPAAMLGVLSMGAVIAELAIVLAAIGALAQIPGLDWLISEGGELLEGIGNAIGKFIGGLFGGIAEGFISSLPQMGTDLSTFMKNLKPFVDGLARIDDSMMDNAESLVDVMFALAKISSKNCDSLIEFGEGIAIFGPNLKRYANAVSGIDTTAVKESANAAKALAEMTNTIPKEGGVASWFAGENSISKFGVEITNLGVGLKGFSDAVSGISTENMLAAANAAKALAEMTNTIPNEGGVSSWFAGDNSISKFATDIIELGRGLKGFSDEIAGVVPNNITAAAEAAKALADMTSHIPDSGGIIAWITGENSISKFADDIVVLGIGLKGFSNSVAGIVPENVTAGAAAAKALAEMTTVIPNQGGMVAWFTGDNSASKFGEELPALGRGLKSFSNSVAGIIPENVTAAASAAKTLAEMTAVIPNQGGMAAWFAGDQSVSKFAEELPALGRGLKGFSDRVAGIVPENISAAAQSAKILAEMVTIIPEQGGVVAWFAGEQSVSKFADDIIELGRGLKGFSDSTSGIVPENVTAAANSAKALAEMVNTIPLEGGIVAWFTGETNIASFAEKLPELGVGLKGFSDSVSGISPDNVRAASDAAKALAEMVGTLPQNADKLIDFGNDIAHFGRSLNSYFQKTKGITSESIAATRNAIDVIERAANVNANGIRETAKAVNELVQTIKNMGKGVRNSVNEFNKALKDIGKSAAKDFLKPFKDIEVDMTIAGRNAVKAFIKGIEGQSSAIKKAGKQIAKDCAEAIEDNASSWKTAGRECVEGFVSGISINTFKAKAQARAMALAALLAAEEALGIASPSKEFYKDGDFAGQGFVNALKDYTPVAYDYGYSMASSARSGLSKAISKISDVIDGNIDSQPTIRPVLDLGNIKSGVGILDNMLDIGSSVGVTAQVGTINSMMNRRNQNGGTNDVVSAIDKLRRDFGDAERVTYNINGLSYSGDADLDEAFKTIIRAAKIERRV